MDERNELDEPWIDVMALRPTFNIVSEILTKQITELRLSQDESANMVTTMLMICELALDRLADQTIGFSFQATQLNPSHTTGWVYIGTNEGSRANAGSIVLRNEELEHLLDKQGWALIGKEPLSDKGRS